MESDPLPPTCGEVVDIPGTTCVGCTAVVQYNMNHMSGFSCCFVASAGGIYVMRPNVGSGKGAVLTSKLWSPDTPKGSVRFTSLVAFLVWPAASHVIDVLRSEQQCEPPDTTCVVSAWEGEGGQGHLTALFFSLKGLLGAGPPTVVVRETSFFKDRGHRRVFRLFYDPLFSTSAAVGVHIVLCSCYDDSLRKDVSHAATAVRGRTLLTPGDSRGAFNGDFSFVMCSTERKDLMGSEAVWCTGAPSCSSSWMAHQPCGGVVSAIVVRECREAATYAMVAMGTTRGRLHLLYSDKSNVMRHSKGPIADLAFCENSDAMYTDWDDAALKQLIRCRLGSAAASAGSNSEAKCNETPAMNLVVLDSLGYVMVVRDVDGGGSVVQMVSDIQQFIALSWRRLPCDDRFNNSSLDVRSRSVETAPCLTTSSPTNSSELLTQRLVFYRRRCSSHLAADTTGNTSHTSPNGLGTCAIAPGGPGQIFSAGLLHMTRVPGPLGRVELVISTMGQLIVFLPWRAEQDSFCISGCIRAVEPMFFVHFVDFFNTGVADLVMGGMHYVLLARRSRSEQCRKAAELMRLLGMERTSIDPTVKSGTAVFTTSEKQGTGNKDAHRELSGF
uniref:Uncharacterized protein n=1 Tax=Trypanosoma congolense (strain IL3000) TaxID=1068625 RepID=G0UUB5_TRYCI|nr:conserved hypothetical protein [Trypanosoma congolense IL3000]